MNIGPIVREFRKKKLYTQKDLSEKCNITRAYLSLIENNKAEINMTTLKRISEALGVPASVILLFSMNESDILADDRECAAKLTEHVKDLIKPLTSKMLLLNRR